MTCLKRTTCSTSMNSCTHRRIQYVLRTDWLRTRLKAPRVLRALFSVQPHTTR